MTRNVNTGNAEPTPADILGPMDVIEAQESGRNAALAGERVTSCPHRGTEPADQARRRMWAAGYAQGVTERQSAAGWPEIRESHASPLEESAPVDQQNAHASPLQETGL